MEAKRRGRHERGSTQVIVVHAVRCYMCGFNHQSEGVKAAFKHSCDLSADFCDLQL